MFDASLDRPPPPAAVTVGGEPPLAGGLPTGSPPATGPVATADPATAHPGTGPATPPLRRSQALAYIAGYFGVWLALFSPIIIVVPSKAEALVPHDKAGALSLILGISAIFGIVAPPVAGRLSDRCTSRFGRRRPYLLGSALVGLASLVGDAASSSLWVFVVTFSVGAIAFGVALTALLAVIPEHVPLARRGKVSGYLGIAQAVAVVVGVGVTGGLSTRSLAAAFVVPGVVGTALVLWLVAKLPDRPITADQRPPLSLRAVFGSFWLDPRENTDFSWAWLSRFAIFMAFAGTVNYQVYFLRDQLGIPEGRTAAYVAIGTGLQVVTVVIASAVAGYLSDRVERRKVFVVTASLLGAVGLLLIAVTPGLPLYFVGLAVVGLGQGAYYAVDLALVADLLPKRRDDDGKNLGIFSLANQVPTSLAPAIAPLFLGIGVGVSGHADNYTALFVASALFAVLAAVTVGRVRAVR